MSLRISLDLDDTIVSFNDHYISRFGEPKKDIEITKNVRGVLLKDKNFWMTQPLVNIPDFIPVQYTTARIIPKRWIREQLVINQLPPSPVYQIMGIGLSKAKMLRGRVDVHIDDSLTVFKDLNSKGIPCLLIDAPHNQEWGPVGRIYSLSLKEIEEAYDLFMKTVFNNFKSLLI